MVPPHIDFVFLFPQQPFAKSIAYIRNETDACASTELCYNEIVKILFAFCACEIIHCKIYTIIYKYKYYLPKNVKWYLVDTSALNHRNYYSFVYFNFLSLTYVLKISMHPLKLLIHINLTLSLIILLRIFSVVSVILSTLGRLHYLKLNSLCTNTLFLFVTLLWYFLGLTENQLYLLIN